jgi:hypothetical protein
MYNITACCYNVAVNTEVGVRRVLTLARCGKVTVLEGLMLFAY